MLANVITETNTTTPGIVNTLSSFVSISALTGADKATSVADDREVVQKHSAGEPGAGGAASAWSAAKLPSAAPPFGALPSRAANSHCSGQTGRAALSDLCGVAVVQLSRYVVRSKRERRRKERAGSGGGRRAARDPNAYPTGPPSPPPPPRHRAVLTDTVYSSFGRSNGTVKHVHSIIMPLFKNNTTRQPHSVRPTSKRRCD
ncbi:hypothetical protein EVAR_68698_1 [Eumeta japonica]|uniref:Uncharacterized protein n=1 Tax=Eumeta variegata TaxID=151549 RepID=A0A4C2A462_EUMVA|nr:hypothetical protein EVAR_68698_1 [Eumeta japonica]